MPRRYDVSNQVRTRLERDYTYHAPNPDQVERMEYLREKAKQLAYAITILTPSGREQSLALTNLENAVFNANSAIVRGE